MARHMDVDTSGWSDVDAADYNECRALGCLDEFWSPGEEKKNKRGKAARKALKRGRRDHNRKLVYRHKQARLDSSQHASSLHSALAHSQQGSSSGANLSDSATWSQPALSPAATPQSTPAGIAPDEWWRRGDELERVLEAARSGSRAREREESLQQMGW
jgi:hypothetical protein